MKSLFSKGSLTILESLSFTRTLYAFDFDGTLSRLVRHPGAAKISTITEVLLMRLSRFAPIAIVSGRGLSDLESRFRFKPQYLVGNHGLEGLGARRNSMKKAQQATALWMRALSKVKFEPGVELEDKVYSIAVHYRLCRKRRKANQSILSAVSNLELAPRVIPGKSVVNLVPSGAPHKGIALLEVMKHAGVRHAFYIGDDDTDEDVFGLPDGQVSVSVRVGEKRSSSARYYIQRQSDINRALKYLLRCYERRVNA
jgi:trehalose 6-phosphate phosphatase